MADELNGVSGEASKTVGGPQSTIISFLARPTGRSGVDRVLQELLLGLVNGRYRPGEKLNANKIVKELGVGLVPVREALHLLAGQGIVELLPQKGARVKGLTREETEGWHEIFRVITLVGIRQAAKAIRTNPANLERLAHARGVIEQMPESSSSPEVASTLLEFHRRTNAFSGSEIVDEASRRLQVVHWVSFVAQYAPMAEHRLQIASNYLRLADALSLADADAAAAAFNYQSAFLTALIRGEQLEVGRSWILDGEL